MKYTFNERHTAQYGDTVVGYTALETPNVVTGKLIEVTDEEGACFIVARVSYDAYGREIPGQVAGVPCMAIAHTLEELRSLMAYNGCVSYEEKILLVMAEQEGRVFA